MKKSLKVLKQFFYEGPLIKFEKTSYEVVEPSSIETVAVVKIKVVRVGDVSKTSKVRVFTRNGNAESGKDYNAFSKGLKHFQNTIKSYLSLFYIFVTSIIVLKKK